MNLTDDVGEDMIDDEVLFGVEEKEAQVAVVRQKSIKEE